MAAAALLSLHFRITFIVCWICLVSAKDKGQFIYEGFNEASLHMDGFARIHQNGLLQLTNTSDFQVGHAFHPSPIKFNTSSSQSLSFSTNFVFSINPLVNIFGGQGMAFVIAPTMNFSGALPSAYLAIFNATSTGLSTNHILAVELDTVQTPQFQDIDGNHVGIDVNGLISKDSASATYFSDTEGKNKSLDLSSGNAIEVWIDYRGVEKLLYVTLAPVQSPKPTRPLLSTSIDLSQILLDSMYVGFSAATATRASDHYILGWSFNTRGQSQNLNKSRLPPPPPPRKASKKKNQLMIVLAVVVVVMFIVVFGAIYIVRKKKRRTSVSIRIYDCMPNGSLDKILYGNMRPNLNSFKRIRIVRRVAMSTACG